MFRGPYLTIMLGLSLAGGPIPAQAQQSDGRDVAYEAWRNSLGLLRYCREKSLLDRASANRAIQASEDGLALFASAEIASVREHGDRAENAGKAGLWGANSQRPIANVAALFDSTPATLCNEWASEKLRGVKLRDERQAPPSNATFQVGPEPARRPAAVEPAKRPATLEAPQQPIAYGAPQRSATSAAPQRPLTDAAPPRQVTYGAPPRLVAAEATPKPATLNGPDLSSQSRPSPASPPKFVPVDDRCP